jgi:hypothetical protein
MHEELLKEKTIIENFEYFWFNFTTEQLIWLLSNYLFEKEDLEKKVKDSFCYFRIKALKFTYFRWTYKSFRLWY